TGRLHRPPRPNPDQPRAVGPCLLGKAGAATGAVHRRPIPGPRLVRGRTGGVRGSGAESAAGRAITHTLGSQHPTVAVTADPTGLARGIGELYTHGITPTGPVHRAHPSLVVSPGGDHTTGPRTSTGSDPDPLPSPHRAEAPPAAQR